MYYITTLIGLFNVIILAVLSYVIERQEYINHLAEVRLICYMR